NVFVPLTRCLTFGVHSNTVPPRRVHYQPATPRQFRPPRHLLHPPDHLRKRPQRRPLPIAQPRDLLLTRERHRVPSPRSLPGPVLRSPGSPEAVPGFRYDNWLNTTPELFAQSLSTGAGLLLTPGS